MTAVSWEAASTTADYCHETSTFFQRSKEVGNMDECISRAPSHAYEKVEAHAHMHWPGCHDGFVRPLWPNGQGPPNGNSRGHPPSGKFRDGPNTATTMIFTCDGASNRHLMAHEMTNLSVFSAFHCVERAFDSASRGKMENRAPQDELENGRGCAWAVP